MNSCRSSEFWACAPPLITFSIGTGRTCAPTPPIQRNSDTPACAAPAFAVASETPRIALAPRRDLFFVPSSSISVRSSVRWSSASSPATAPAISVSTLRTALRTLLPRYDRSSPSRNSTASNCPVDAPEGTAARPVAPDSSTTSTSTVGFPLESRICRPCTRAIEEALIRTPPWRDRSSDLVLPAAARRTPSLRLPRSARRVPRARRSGGTSHAARARDPRSGAARR